MIRTRWHIRIACDKECNQSGTKIDPEIKCPGIAFTLLNFHFLNSGKDFLKVHHHLRDIAKTLRHPGFLFL